MTHHIIKALIIALAGIPLLSFADEPPTSTNVEPITAKPAGSFILGKFSSPGWIACVGGQPPSTCSNCYNSCSMTLQCNTGYNGQCVCPPGYQSNTTVALEITNAQATSCYTEGYILEAQIVPGSSPYQVQFNNVYGVSSTHTCDGIPLPVTFTFDVYCYPQP